MNRLEDIFETHSSEKCTFGLILFATVNSLLLHSAVQSADAAHLLSLKVAYIKNRAKHISSMCWQTVEHLVSRTDCTVQDMYNYHCAVTSKNVQLPYNKQQLQIYWMFKFAS